MIRFRSYRTRLQAALLALGLGAVAITGWEASQGATSALEAATNERLTAVRRTKGRQIERYFRDLGNHVLALSADESAVSAMEQFKQALPASMVDRQALHRVYDELFREVLPREADVRRRVDAWFPEDPVALTLQHLFIARNPHPPGSRFHQLAAEGDTRYSRIHARFHPTFHRYLSAFHFYDIFLIADDGRVVYTVAKEIDLGTKLTAEPYRQTTLARAWRRAMALPEPETYVVEDYAPYLPSKLAPAAFVAAPVYRAGAKIGVLAIQLSIADVNAMMAGQWADEGLGRTGQTYLIGNDGTLRSDLRMEIERPEEFYSALERASVPAETVERIRRYRTAVLNLKVDPHIRSLRVLRSQAPLDIEGLNWTVVAEIDTEEALAPVRSLHWRILWQSLLVALALVIAARYLARRVTEPLVALAGAARRLGQRDFTARAAVQSEDEVGRLALAFNSMAEDLAHTTVSKRELDRILASLINAVFVIDVSPGATPDDVLEAPVREMNRAARELLHAQPGVRFRELIPAADVDAWRERTGRALTQGQLHPEQAALRAEDDVPVLFSASWLADEPGTRPGLVCVAQSIAEWKAAQDKLRRMSKVFMDATDPILIADRAGRIVDCNPEAERAYGWSAAELAGRRLVDLFPSDKAGRLLERCMTGEAVRNLETVQVDRSGRGIPVLVTLSLLAGEDGEPAGVAAIAKDITELKSVEQALQALTGKLIAAQEDERARLARELHDDLTQRLAAVAIEAGRLERMASDESQRAALQNIKRQMAVLSDEIHGLSRRLHPSTLDDLGLVAAVESECRAFFERTGTPVDLKAEDPLPPLSREAGIAVYRIVQEALRNIQKHADADDVSLTLSGDNGNICLTIRDNGRGFDRGSERGHGIGLASMEERARLIGANLEVRSSPGAGTTIEVTVPHEKAHNSARR